MAERAPTKPEHAPAPGEWERARPLLLRSPELILGDAELLRTLQLRPTNVIDFAALARVEAARNAELSARQEIEAVAEANFSAQVQSQAAVLDLLEARNNSDLADRLDRAARDRFGLAGAVLAVEGPEPAPAGWRALPAGGVDALLGEGRATRLGPIALAHHLFSGAELPGSVALVRTAPWPGRSGVLAFSAAAHDGFAPDMAVELIVHVAAVVERIAARWPVLSPAQNP
jgi:uncharacterized protein YigA (DUF484 family)